MRTIALIALLVFGMASQAEAGRRSGRSYGMTGTGSSSKSHSVRGYTTKRGTYVAPYKATSADHTQRNNYGTKNNVNPWNGKTGKRYATH